MTDYGKRTWFIPDGEVPFTQKGNISPHEAIIITNPNERDARINFTFYFRDKDPIGDIEITLEKERMIDIHLNNLEELPVTLEQGEPYSVMIKSDTGIIVQHSRLVAIEDHYSLFTTIAYSQK